MPRKFQRTASKNTMLSTLAVVLIVGGAVAGAIFLKTAPDAGSRAKSSVAQPLTFGPNGSSASKEENSTPSVADLPDLKRAEPLATSGEDRKFSNDTPRTSEAIFSGGRTRSGIDSTTVANQPFAASKLPLNIAVSGNGSNTSNEASSHSGGTAASRTTLGTGFEGSPGTAMSDPGQAIGSNSLKMSNDASSRLDGATASGTIPGTGLESSRGTIMSGSGQAIGTVPPSTSTSLAPDATIVWQGAAGGNANVWNRAANWVGGVQPTINDTAQFNNTANSSNLAPSIGATATSVGAILFPAGTTNAYNISGTATLTLGSATASGITNNSATNQTVSVSNITLGVSQTWNVGSTGNLSISSNVSVANPITLTVGGSSTGVGTISGVISGGGNVSNPSLVKVGSGTWTLTGANTYTGPTNVNGGTLLVNGSISTNAFPVTVSNSGTTLGGTGTIGGDTNATPSVIVNSGANIAPGNGGNTTGILTATALTMNAGSNFLVNINGTTVGTGYDQLSITGAGANIAVITGSNIVVTVGATLPLGSTFTVLQRTAGGNNTVTGQFAQGGQVVAQNGFVFAITYNNPSGTVILTLIDVPEPSTWFVGGLALTALVFTQRRRLKRLLLPS